MARYLAINQQVHRRQKIRRRNAGPAIVWDWQAFLAVVGIAALILAAALVSVWSSGRSLALRYDIKAKSDQRERLNDQKTDVKLEISRLIERRRLESEAKRLGLVKAKPDQIIKVQMKHVPQTPSK